MSTEELASLSGLRDSLDPATLERLKSQISKDPASLESASHFKDMTLLALNGMLRVNGHHDRLVRLIIQTFKTGATDKHPLCLPALDAAMYHLFKKRMMQEFTQEWVEYTEKEPELVNALVDFIFSQNSSATMESMETELIKCTCDRKDLLLGMLHIPCISPAYSLYTHFQVLSSTLFRFLCMVVNTTDKAKLDRMKARGYLRPKDRGYERLSHYLMQDGHQMLLACTEWFKKSETTCIPDFLTRAMNTYRPAFEKNLGKMGKELPDVLIRRMLELVTKAIKDTSGDGRVDDVVFITTFLSASVIRTQKSVWWPFMQPCAKTIYSGICQMVRMVKGKKFPGVEGLETFALPAVSAFAIRAYEIILATAGPGEEKPQFELALLEYRDRGETRLNNMTCMNLVRLIAEIKKERRCANLDCRRAPSSTLKPFRRCAGCKTIYYCSKECQRCTWADGRFPHKLVCKDWNALTTHWPQDNIELAKLAGDENMDGINARLQERIQKACPGFDHEKITRVYNTTTCFTTADSLAALLSKERKRN